MEETMSAKISRDEFQEYQKFIEKRLSALEAAIERINRQVFDDPDAKPQPKAEPARRKKC
jgi:hypothetical protein